MRLPNVLWQGAVVVTIALTMAVHNVNAQSLNASDGIFTPAQAERGKESYETYCAACHGFDLVATDSEASTLTGGAFSFAWHRTTINERFDRISTTMPPGSAGVLEEQEYLDVVSYILSFNGYAAGEVELTPEVLESQTIEVGKP